MPAVRRAPRAGLLPLLAVGALTALARPAAAQGGAAIAPATAPLTLAAALRAADGGAYANRIAAGTAAAERARALAPLRGVLPTARVEGTAVRTTDPIGAFGGLLRQRLVTPAAFDPQRLNFPAPLTTVQSALVAELPLVNADAWAGRRAALRAADASGAQAAWTRRGVRADVVRAYWGAVLAAERAATLAAAARAADAHVAQAQAMVRQGVVTKADALLASVRAGEVHAQRAEALGAAADARRQLATLLGTPEAADAALPATLPPADAIRGVAARDTLRADAADARADATRADVQAARLGRDAAATDARRARAALLPRVNAFGRLDWFTPGTPFGGRSAWTVGVMAALPLLPDAAQWSDVRAADGRADAARAGAEAAVARARLEVEATRTALLVALERLTIAEQGAAQGAEAQRLVEKRYAGGLAPVTELLDAQAAATGSALALAAARYGVIAAAAERRLALGADPGALAALDAAAPPVAPVAPR